MARDPQGAGETGSSLASRLRELPAVNRILDAITEDGAPRARLTEIIREVIGAARVQVLSGGAVPGVEELAAAVTLRRQTSRRPFLRPAINATGVVLHTGLGRAVLAQEVVENLARVASGHSTLEIDEETGHRGSRVKGITALLASLVGCEDVAVVNNNAAAVLLSIQTLAQGQEVVISRGELVEIGGQFRIPDVITSAGARLVEVGTTNKTHLADYARAIGPETALLLHVHPSNFRVVGFASGVPLEEMGALAREKEIPFVADLGSGALFDLAAHGVPGEPTVQQILGTGVDVCTWSGDKLLGGPQCGLIVGRAELVGRMKRHPLMRALRVDKLILAALEATLRLYLEGESVREKIPTLRAITRPPAEVEETARRLARQIVEKGGNGVQAEVVRTTAQVGGGSLPGESLPSFAVALRIDGVSPDALARRLRTGTPPVFGRIAQDALLLDLRTVLPGEEEALVGAAAAALERC